MAEVRPLTCAGCGLLCDDVILRSDDDGAHLEPPCRLGAEWFSARMYPPAGTPAATVDGQAAEVDVALARAAELLRGARRPLVHGFDGATVEDVTGFPPTVINVNGNVAGVDLFLAADTATPQDKSLRTRCAV